MNNLFFYDYSETPTTKYGVDRLELTIAFLHVIEAEVDEHEAQYNGFKSYLSEKIGRELTAEEELNLAQGLLNYIQSEAQTNERLKAMEYLFGLEFLHDELKQAI